MLHGADARIAALAEFCDGEVLLYAADGLLPALQTHRIQGGRTVHLRQGQLVLARGSEETVMGDINTLRSAAGLPAEAVLAAVAVAWALGLSTDLVAAGLKTYPVSEDTPHGP